MVGVVPVSGELDLKALAEAAGGRRAELAEPEAAQRATGSVVGGISPLGHRRPMPVYVDAGAAGAQWLLKGDAAQRALIVWSMGWAPAQQASGHECGKLASSHGGNLHSGSWTAGPYGQYED